MLGDLLVEAADRVGGVAVRRPAAVRGTEIPVLLAGSGSQHPETGMRAFHVVHFGERDPCHITPNVDDPIPRDRHAYNANEAIWIIRGY